MTRDTLQLCDRMLHDSCVTGPINHAHKTDATHLYDELPIFFNVFVCLLLLTLHLRFEGDIDVHPQLLAAQTDDTCEAHAEPQFMTIHTHFLYPSYSLTTEQGWRVSSSQICCDGTKCTTHLGVP